MHVHVLYVCAMCVGVCLCYGVFNCYNIVVQAACILHVYRSVSVPYLLCIISRRIAYLCGTRVCVECVSLMCIECGHRVHVYEI